MRTRIRVEGIVQGVGFRPFVHALATRHGLGGLVGNDGAGVFIEVEGAAATITAFTAALAAEAPPLAVVERITARPVADAGDRAFVIAPSKALGARRTLISADTATCADCLRELSDPTDRRYRYPFVNCTNCGPRFTIVTGVPYDRPATTMAGFPLCAECEREYHDPADRRFHAQPVCCPACGPALALTEADGTPIPGDPITAAATLLRAGEVVAVKGLGGYHLAADATSEAGVTALRTRKHRADRPFALMVAGPDAARALCTVDAEEERALTSAARPIVMLRRHPDAAVAGGVAPGNRYLGLMLPYTPLHHLLLDELGRPAVLTSGNVADEPIAYTDADAADRLAPIADAFLTHDRPIHMRTDDSVLRIRRGRAYPIRRSRGYAPAPLRVEQEFTRPVLACGAELKNTFCLGKGRHAFVSHHIGDLENYETYRSFTEGIAHLERLFDVVPEVVAHDLHPEYLSTKYALDLDGVDTLGVQHHHAHIASCLADNGVPGPVIGVAFDGTGYGPDGTIWGGEFLVADLTGYTRHGRLAPVPMPGGAAAITEPWRMAAAYLDAAFDRTAPAGLAVRARNAGRWDAVLRLARSGVNAPLTSSAGRLFDAVAALVGVRDAIHYEGQAAVELERLADPAEPGGYPVDIDAGTVFAVRGDALVRAVADEIVRGVPAPVVAARFHRAVATAIAAGAERVRDTTGLGTVALSGGVFQNVLLLDLATALLEARGFQVLTHGRVPTNDGGISLGQAAVAAASHAR
jgi:hydrogenase maturation protein HypF